MNKYTVTLESNTTGKAKRVSVMAEDQFDAMAVAQLAQRRGWTPVEAVPAA